MTRGRRIFELSKRTIKISVKASAAIWLLTVGGAVTMTVAPLVAGAVVIALGPPAVVMSALVGIAFLRKTLSEKEGK